MQNYLASEVVRSKVLSEGDLRRQDLSAAKRKETKAAGAEKIPGYRSQNILP